MDAASRPAWSSQRRDPRAPLSRSALLAAWSPPDTCAFQGTRDIRGCREPRACSDCLQRDVRIPIVLRGCMVSGAKCASANEYVEALDYRYATHAYKNSTYQYVAINTTSESFGAVQYLANSTSYCTESDPVCVSCRTQREAKEVPFFEFCVGADGCVCIGGCEPRAMFLYAAQEMHCRLGDSRGDSTSAIIMVTLILTTTLLILWTRLWVKDITSRRGDDSAHADPEPRETPVRGLRRYMLDVAPALHLDLYGWRHFRNEIVRKEQELLSGAGDVSPVARPMAFEFAAIPTAPDFDEEEESTAPTITNPHALASAPVFRLRSPTHHTDATLENDPNVPSAPDFE